MGKDNDMAKDRDDFPGHNQIISTTDIRDLVQQLRAEGDISAPASLLPTVLSRLGLPATPEQDTCLDSDLALAYCNKGNNYSSIKRYEESLVAYDQALSLDPNCTLAYRGKGDVLCNLNRYEEALVAYDQALSLDPNDLSVSTSKYNILRRLKETKTNSDDDLSLVLGAQKGDENAFEALYKRYYARIALYLSRMTGNDEDGKDLAQETFMKAWEALSRLRNPASFASWLYRIATNYTYDYQRRLKRHTVALDVYKGIAHTGMKNEGQQNDEKRMAGTEMCRTYHPRELAPDAEPPYLCY